MDIVDLSEAYEPAVVELCRTALDLPEDAAEAAEIVARLRERHNTAGWATSERRLVGAVAVDGGRVDGGRVVGGRVVGGQVVGGRVVGGRVVGAVLGSLGHDNPATGHVDLFAVHPDARRHGLARALLGRVESALADLGATHVEMAGNAPYYAWPGIDVRYTPAVCTVLALGYEQVETAWNMTADVADCRADPPAEDRLAARGMHVREATGADVAELVEFATTHFSPRWAGEISHSIERTGGGCHIALDADGSVVGFAAYGSSRPSWFGPMGTAPAARGTGIGAVLLRRCLDDQWAAGRGRVQIGWVGPVPFYAQVAGARVERVFFRYRKAL